ncbi:MAG TPA: hypothetical protein VFP35_00755 [Candidatus Saccharimonadales bacterium]|nr:hypothetical protein [Candidatus Saccharimonadales bacterium]
MNKSQKGFSAIEGLLILVIFGVIAIVGIYVYSNTSTKSLSSISIKSGADIEIISGAGGMPPNTSSGELLVGEKFTVVFTAPFSSLENWQASKEIKEVSTTSGRASIDLPAGKYGAYYIYKGHKTLYSGLTLENPRNDIQRDKQGPWYIKINNLQRTKLNFSVNAQPV